MPMYNLIVYSHNYSDTSEVLWQFKRSEVDAGNKNYADITTAIPSSFMYKLSLFANTEANEAKNSVKRVVPLKCLPNFWRWLEIPFINCKVELSFMWNNNIVDSTTFKIKDAELYVPACYPINKRPCKTNKTTERKISLLQQI